MKPVVAGSAPDFYNLDQSTGKQPLSKLSATTQKKAPGQIIGLGLYLEEEVGFEPTVPCGTPDFESGTFGHSATLPWVLVKHTDTDFSRTTGWDSPATRVQSGCSAGFLKLLQGSDHIVCCDAL
jgi:hypothetical protein